MLSNKVLGGDYWECFMFK